MGIFRELFGETLPWDIGSAQYRTEYTTDDPLLITMRCHYEMVNFHKIRTKRHLIAHPWSHDLWIQTLIYDPPESQQYCMKYHVILDRVMTAHDCTTRALAGQRHTLRWRHNGRDSVSNHQPHDCLLNRLFRRRSNKTSKLRVTGLCADNSSLTREFPAQMASNAENVSIWWRHHVILVGKSGFEPQ